jgi:hypothetical protein
MAESSAEPPAAAQRGLPPRVDEDKSKMDQGNCEVLGRASIKCIEDHGYNRKEPACQVHYDAYRECRKRETELKRRQRQANAKSLFG